MVTTLRETSDSVKDIDNFIEKWHQFPIDYWWRKKHNVPFGSQQHRDMNFIDMLFEYREEIVVNKYRRFYQEKEEAAENDALGLSNERVVPMSKEEIDEDYENLNLEDFNK